jgi:alcohol dehydrogenase (NADP+)
VISKGRRYDALGNLSVTLIDICDQFTPKIFEEYDVDIENECCGVCGSDVHTITGGWGELATSPICVGHEIIGKVLRVGPKVKSIKPGDRVGVGAQVQSCMKCPMCKSDNENYCPHMVGESSSFPTRRSVLISC